MSGKNEAKEDQSTGGGFGTVDDGVGDALFEFFGKKVTVLVQFLGENYIFLIGAIGLIQGLDEIEKELNEPETLEIFQKGCGEYVFECSYDSGQFDEMHRCELPPYWELEEVAFKPFKTE